MSIGHGSRHLIRLSSTGIPRQHLTMRDQRLLNESPAVTLLTFPIGHEAAPHARARAPLAFDSLSQTVLRQLERLAPSMATVLISGETGTGKELVASYIHERSGRGGPFVAVNCGAFSEQLVEAELFGHEVGAFTGARQARAGWFEAARGGTLLLDEVGDLPLSLQVKLLRVLQEKQVIRIGSRKPIKIDVRVLAATNVDLEAAVAAKQFRRDLFYRINVAAIRLTPLRERPDDILPLARYFIETFRAELGCGQVVLSSAAEPALLQHHWPGNVRELENAIHVGLIVCRDGVLDIGDLRLPPPENRTESMRQGESSSLLQDVNSSLRRLLASNQTAIYESVERLLLVAAFEQCGGNQVHTAKLLGISRNILRGQLKRFGLLRDARRDGKP
jgi:sigma-54-specific transcriptional regulator